MVRDEPAGHTSVPDTLRESGTWRDPEKTRSGDLAQRALDVLCVGGPHQAGHFLAIAQEDQRRPEFDADRAAQRAPDAPFAFEMFDLRRGGTGLLDERLGGLAKSHTYIRGSERG